MAAVTEQSKTNIDSSPGLYFKEECYVFSFDNYLEKIYNTILQKLAWIIK